MMMDGRIMANREMMLKRIQQIEFMAIELNLYLNTHPCDARALNQYNFYTNQLIMLKKQFEQIYGPIAGFGSAPAQRGWQWIYEPWPWEVDREEGEY